MKQAGCSKQKAYKILQEVERRTGLHPKKKETLKDQILVILSQKPEGVAFCEIKNSIDRYKDESVKWAVRELVRDEIIHRIEQKGRSVLILAGEQNNDN